jgi:septin family protein
MPLDFALQNAKKMETADPWTKPNPKPATLTNELGIRSLPQQKYKQASQHPFYFNIMVVGQSGLGKTTLMNSLFNTDLTSSIDPKRLLSNEHRTLTLQPHFFGIHPLTKDLKENGVSLKLTYIDTPGFANGVNRQKTLVPILDYIDQQYKEWLEHERNPSRVQNPTKDSRVHCILYFIAPSCQG